MRRLPLAASGVFYHLIYIYNSFSLFIFFLKTRIAKSAVIPVIILQLNISEFPYKRRAVLSLWDFPKILPHQE